MHLVKLDHLFVRRWAWTGPLLTGDILWTVDWSHAAPFDANEAAKRFESLRERGAAPGQVSIVTRETAARNLPRRS